MSNFNSKSSATTATAKFNDMLQNFGVVTVMNARVFKKPLYGLKADGTALGIIAQPKLAAPEYSLPASSYVNYKAHDVLKALLEVSQSDYVTIDTLKIANINMEGPTKTVTGGQYVNPLIKFGKTATIEMQDALGRAEAIEALGGGIIETYDTGDGFTEGYTNVLHLTQDFAGAKTILGESFFIDQKTGAQVKVYILLYEMLPDSIFNLTQDAEGDATVFDLNGSLSAVDILVGPAEMSKDGIIKGTFYSVLPQDGIPVEPPTPSEVTLTYAAATGANQYVEGYIAGKDDDTYVIGTSVTLPVVESCVWYTTADASEAISASFIIEEDTTVYLKDSE